MKLFDNIAYIDEILGFLSDGVRRRPDGSYDSLDGYTSSVARTLLQLHTRLDPQISEFDREQMVRDSVFDISKSGTVSRATLEAALHKRVQVYLSRPQHDFVVFGTLSATLPVSPKGANKTRIGGCVINWASPDARFPRESLSEKHFPDLRRLHPSSTKGFTWLRISTKARTEAEAFWKAEDSFDLIRGLWNYYLNRGTRLGGSWPPQPINQIRGGPLRTLHFPSGKAVGTTYRYDRFPNPSCADLRDKWKGVREFEKKLRGWLKRLSYRGKMELAFRRYARALDSVDYEICSLKLWSLLEYLTACEGQHGKLVERVLFLVSDDNLKLNHALLDALREQRNRSVHRDEAMPSANSVVYLMKHFCEVFIRYHLFEGPQYNTLEEAVELLSLSRDAETLKQQLASRQRALKVRHKVESEA